MMKVLMDEVEERSVSMRTIKPTMSKDPMAMTAKAVPIQMTRERIKLPVLWAWWDPWTAASFFATADSFRAFTRKEIVTNATKRVKRPAPAMPAVMMLVLREKVLDQSEMAKDGHAKRKKVKASKKEKQYCPPRREIIQKLR